MTRVGRVALIALLLATLPVAARAGMMAPCSAPEMFPDAGVTVFVFPYVDHTSPESRRIESPVGTELAGLIQIDTLLAISRFGNVASIRLMGRPSDCRPERVLADLLDRFGPGRPGRAVVMVWGRIFRIDKDIYVQSYASFRRFVRDDPGDAIQLPLGDRTLVGQLATQTIAFAPRHVSDQDLTRIRDRYARENIVHQDANEGSPGRPLLTLFPDGARPAYYVSDVLDDWIRIQANSGQGGWVLARGMLGEQSLSARLPEMRFVEGVAGYFSVRDKVDARRSELAGSALRAFEESPLNRTEPTALAVSMQLRGLITLLAQKQSPAAFDEAGSLFTRAAALLPSNSAAGNLAAVAATYREWQTPGRQLDFQSSVNRFWSSIAADPNDKTALTNCWTLFVLAQNPQHRSRFVLPQNVTVDSLARKSSAMEQVQIDGTQVALTPLKPVVPWPPPGR